ncbi:CDC27 family protein, partial [Acinetobacter baumannii]
GNYLEEQKNFLDAYAVFEKAAKLDAKSARSWLGYAKTSFELKKYAEAYDAFKKSCLLDKKTAPAFRKAASVLRLSKNSEWSGKFEET